MLKLCVICSLEFDWVGQCVVDLLTCFLLHVPVLAVGEMCLIATLETLVYREVHALLSDGKVPGSVAAKQAHIITCPRL